MSYSISVSGVREEVLKSLADRFKTRYKEAPDNFQHERAISRAQNFVSEAPAGSKVSVSISGHWGGPGSGSAYESSSLNADLSAVPVAPVSPDDEPTKID